MQQDEERMEQLTNQLKESRMMGEDADGKSDDISRKLAFVEDELEAAEERVKSGHSKVQELDEELQVFHLFYFATVSRIFLGHISLFCGLIVKYHLWIKYFV